MRIVLDTGILARANTKSKGPAREVLLAIAKGSHELITSPFLLTELERVLHYPRLRVRHGLSEQDIQEHLEYLRDISELVNAVVRDPIVQTDPDDDAVIYAALDGRADVLCTLDRDFYQPSVVAFCRQHRIAIMNDVDLLRLISPHG